MNKENKATTAFIIGACLLLLIAMTGCKSQSTIVAVERHDSIRTDDRDHSHYEREKEYIHDSIYIHDKGDTVWVDRWHDRIIERTVADTVHDTTRIETRDSIPYPVEVPVYVRQRNTYDKATAKGFWILLAIIVITVVVWIGNKRCWWVKPISWISKIL
ncbi:MAG: hypothetical protein MJZ64_00270 [Paludibacteraceae bacterium]|nr:hypothetical protein [Paludibacteraceae bacterium]